MHIPYLDAKQLIEEDRSMAENYRIIPIQIMEYAQGRLAALA